jgi:hypothetical protein
LNNVVAVFLRRQRSTHALCCDRLLLLTAL